MTLYFMSDLHFQHQLVAHERGFKSPEEHDETVIHNTNKIVSSQDDLFILGDVAMNANGLGWRNNLKLLNQMPGRKHLIMGNHDRCAPNQSNGFNYQQDFLKYFVSINDFVRIAYEGQRILVSHYPYYNDESIGYHENASYDNRFQQYQLPDRGHLLIHGHTHSKKFITKSAKGSIQVNVNLDSTDLKPMSIDDIYRAACTYVENEKP